jgi:predicted GH43/DUF377 family glycosyl hydrolase
MTSSRRCLLLAIAFLPPALHAEVADWMLGPFVRPEPAAPALRADPDAVFNDPIRKIPVHWEGNAFNPAAIVKDGKVYLLYRSSDGLSNGNVGPTSRIGLASSADGIHFTRNPEPVLYPDNDGQKDREWPGGCEDPRCIETEDGTYVLFYTQYWGEAKMGMATSRDLLHWTKTGPVVGHDDKGRPVQADRAASLVCSVRDGRLIATRINGKYWLYYGGGEINLMSSENLHDWTQVSSFKFKTRDHLFDSGLVEGGPPALLTAKGIVVLYNGANKNDPTLKHNTYTDGQALFDARDPAHLLARSEQPFFKPETPWEVHGNFDSGTVFIEGLVLFHDQWMLYFGCADTVCGVAVAPVKPGEILPP